jgi:transposase-like protein
VNEEVPFSTLSRRLVQSSAKKLQELLDRDLSDHEMVALFVDGKTFASDEMIIALGVTLTGEKVFLGLLQTATENEKSPMGKSFKTTNCIESIMSLVGQRTDKADHWKISSQKQRWVARP